MIDSDIKNSKEILTSVRDADEDTSEEVSEIAGNVREVVDDLLEDIEKEQIDTEGSDTLNEGQDEDEPEISEDIKDLWPQFLKTVDIYRDSFEEICVGTSKGRSALKYLIRYCRKNSSVSTIYDYLDGEYIGAGIFEAAVRSALIVAFFCKTFDYDEESTEKAITAALIHDVGESFGQLAGRDHAEHVVLIFKKILACHDDRVDRDVKDAVFQHHEAYDGSGYPFGLFGEHVSVMASLLRIVDDFIILSGSTAEPEAIADEIKKNRDKYAPGIFDSFIKLVI